MMEKESLGKIVERITQMEGYFDRIQAAVKTDPKSLNEDESLKKMLRILTEYYENGQWLIDYIHDENGELPAGMKRGVLSEDGVYNLLYEIENGGFYEDVE